MELACNHCSVSGSNDGNIEEVVKTSLSETGGVTTAATIVERIRSTGWSDTVSYLHLHYCLYSHLQIPQDTTVHTAFILSHHLLSLDAC